MANEDKLGGSLKIEIGEFEGKKVIVCANGLKTAPAVLTKLTANGFFIEDEAGVGFVPYKSLDYICDAPKEKKVIEPPKKKIIV